MTHPCKNLTNQFLIDMFDRTWEHDRLHFIELIARVRTTPLRHIGQHKMDHTLRQDSLPDLLGDIPNPHAEYQDAPQCALRKLAWDCQIRYPQQSLAERTAVENANRRRKWKDFRKNMVITLWLLILVAEIVLLKIVDTSVTCFVRFCVNKFVA